LNLQVFILRIFWRGVFDYRPFLLFTHFLGCWFGVREVQISGELKNRDEKLCRGTSKNSNPNATKTPRHEET